MASYHLKQRDPLLDQETQAMLEKRGRELLGVGLLLLAVLFGVILGSYSPTDPGWMVASDGEVSNWLGRFGAGVASALLMIGGMGSWLIVVILAVWGGRFVLHIGQERATARVTFAVIAVALASIFASTHVPSASWPHAAVGLGGLFGDTVLAAVLAIVPVGAGFGLKVLSLLFGLGLIAMTLFVTGFDMNELRRIGRFLTVGATTLYDMALRLAGRSAAGTMQAASRMQDRQRARKLEAAEMAAHSRHEAQRYSAEPPMMAPPSAPRMAPRMAAPEPAPRAADYAPDMQPAPLRAGGSSRIIRPAGYQPPQDQLSLPLREEDPVLEPMLTEPEPYATGHGYRAAPMQPAPPNYPPLSADPAPEVYADPAAERPGLLARVMRAAGPVMGIAPAAEPAAHYDADPAFSGPDEAEDRIKARINDVIRSRVRQVPNGPQSPLQAAISRREPPLNRRGPQPLIAHRPSAAVTAQRSAVATPAAALASLTPAVATAAVSMAAPVAASVPQAPVMARQPVAAPPMAAAAPAPMSTAPEMALEEAWWDDGRYEPVQNYGIDDYDENWSAPAAAPYQAPQAVAPAAPVAAPVMAAAQPAVRAPQAAPSAGFATPSVMHNAPMPHMAAAPLAPAPVVQSAPENIFAPPQRPNIYEEDDFTDFNAFAAEDDEDEAHHFARQPVVTRAPVIAPVTAPVSAAAPVYERQPPLSRDPHAPAGYMAIEDEDDDDFDAPQVIKVSTSTRDSAADLHRIVQPAIRKPIAPSRQAVAESQPRMSFEEQVSQPYELPPLGLLASPDSVQRHSLSEEALEENARMLESVLDDYGVKGEIVSVRPGPVVTMYELEPAPGLKASRVIGLADDIARSMSALSARVSTVPGRSVIGIELPNNWREKVVLREILAARDFGDSQMRLPLALGKDIGGEPVVANLAKMPHLLIAGTTGSGKSVAINTMILSLLYKLTPEECRLIMIDPKMLELSVYDGIPHLLSPVVTDPKKAVVALKWVVGEMEERYRKMSKMGVRNIEGYNGRVREAVSKGEMFRRTIQTGFDEDTGEPVFETEEFAPVALPYIVVIVDEMADLMMVAGKEIEACIQRLAQMARASGIHLIMATQRPSVDVITGTIKANFPTRISFQVTSKIDSRTILGEMGAEQLLGMGDMLYMAGGARITRIHGPFVSDEEVEEVVNHLKSFGPPSYMAGVMDGPDEEAASDIDAVLGLGGNTDGEDSLYDQAVAIVARDRKCSTSYIQRKLGIGYNKAAKLVEQMEEQGVVTPANHVGKREILIPEA